MRKGWKATTLGNVLDIQNGYAFDSKKFSDDGDMPLIRIRDLKVGTTTVTRFSGEYEAKYLVRAGDLLIGMDGEFACYEWKGSPALLNQRVCRLQNFSSSLLPRFLFYGINKFLKDIEDVTTFTTVKHLSGRQIKAIEFPLPPLPEQKRIVDILDEAFAGIATAVANTEKNLANARELFESYLNGVFSEQWEGWAKRCIGDICTLKSGTSVGKNYEKKSGDVAYIKVSDMNFAGNETEIVSSSRFLSRRDISENSIFPVGTTIFPKRGGAIATNKKRLTSIPVCADLNVMGVIPSQNLNPKFLFFYFLQIDMGKLGGGSSIPQINNYDISPLMIAFPTSVEEQGAVVSKLEEIWQEAKRLECVCQQKLNALTELKQSLLQKAFSGELTAVPQGEIETALA